MQNLFAYISKPISSNPIWFVYVYVLGAICNTLVLWNGSRKIGFLQLFIDVYVLTAIITVLPLRVRKIVKIWLSIFFCLISVVDLFCFYRFHLPISSTLLHIFFQTSRSEAIEALKSYIIIDSTTYPALTILLLSILFVGAALNRRVRTIVGKAVLRFKTWISFSVVCALAISLYFSGLNSVFLFYRLVLGKNEKETFEAMQYSPNVRFYTPVHRLAISIIEYREERDVIESLLLTIDNSVVEDCSFASPNIVLIIGESYSRHHSNLYGYDKPTTPYQCEWAKDSNFVVFDDVIASWNLTYDVFRNLFSTQCTSDSGEWHEYPLFTTLYKNAGYDVTLFSNQFVVKGDSYSSFQENVLLNDRYMSEAQFHHRNDERFKYDEELVREYERVKDLSSRGNLIILHLMGQHVDFEERYPEQWEAFVPSMYPNLPPEDAAMVARYDNATLYNDYVLSCIVEMFKDTESIIIHTSDHGERSGLRGDGYGRSFTFREEDIEEQYEVPFWVFMTKEYEKNHPDIRRGIVDSSHKPLCTDNIAHLLLSLAGIRTPYYNASYDPLSKDFDGSRHRLIWDTFNYDREHNYE